MPLQTDPASAAAEELLQQAEASRRAGDPALAAALYQRVLSLWPESAAARIAAGRLDTLGLPDPAPAGTLADAGDLSGDDSYLPGELAAACLRAAALVCLVVLSLMAGWLLVDAAVGHGPSDSRAWLPGVLVLLAAIVLPALLATIAGIGLNLVALRRRQETLRLR